MIYLIILAGGSGKRIAPLSQEALPKQFIKFVGELSLFQSVILQHNFTPIVVSNVRYRNIIHKQIKEINSGHVNIILEEEKLGTALAIAVAAFFVKPEDLLVVIPSDILINDHLLYQHAVDQAIAYSVKNNVITSVVVKAKNSYLPYGYVKLSVNSNLVQEFIEKPTSLINYTNYYWNTGVFTSVAGNYLAKLKKHNPNLFNKCSDLFAASHYDNNLLIPPFHGDDLSVEKVIMEKMQNNAAVIGGFGWSDLGSWSELYNFISKAKKIFICKNVPYEKGIFMKEVILGKLILVIAENIACLFCREFLQEINYYTERLWGKYSVFYSNKTMLMKYLVLEASLSTSLQKHKYRSENWLIISGSAKITIGNKIQPGKVGDVFFVPKECQHRIENISHRQKLYIIEVQLGNILSEEDIVRL